MDFEVRAGSCPPEGLAMSQTSLGLSKGEVPWLSNSPSLEALKGSLPRTKGRTPATVSLFPLGLTPGSPSPLCFSQGPPQICCKDQKPG